MTGSKNTQKKNSGASLGKSKSNKKTLRADGAIVNGNMKNGISEVTITDSTDMEIYLPDEYPSDMVRPKSWELQNRKSFYQWLMDNFNKYELADKGKRAKLAEEGKAPFTDRLIPQLQPIQKLVRDLNSTASPYRGMLLFYGLGIGKTISAIAVAEAIYNRRGVVFMSKASLEDNFRKNVKKGGSDYMVERNYWVFAPMTSNSASAAAFDQLRERLGISVKLADELGGIYLIDYTKSKSNYQTLSPAHREGLDKQINSLINDRFRFIHTDDTRVLRKVQPTDFDNKVVIVDEVHNLTNNMTKVGGSGAVWYEMMMKAQNAKFIFLTGTPIINKVFEASRMFNILRGYIPVVEIRFQAGLAGVVDSRAIKTALRANRNIDQYVYSPVAKQLKITKNPDGYLTSLDTKTPGVIYVDPVKSSAELRGQLQNIDEFAAAIDKVLKGQGLKYTLAVRNETALPENEELFEQVFYNPEINKLKKTELFKKRIAGLTSYYDYKDDKRFPTLNNNGQPHLVLCPMNEYQLGIYERYRHEEIQKDKKAMQKSKNDEDMMNSTYRIHSRFACTFVYPDDMPNPYDATKKPDLLLAQQEQAANAGEELPDIDLENENAIEAFVKERLLKTLRRDKERYFSMTAPGGLAKLSPKYLAMLRNIQSQAEANTCILVYSYFRTLIGLNMFALALEATGEWEPFKIRKVDGQWHLITDNPDYPGERSLKKKDSREKTVRAGRKDIRTNRYVFYSGNEDREYKEIIPLIFSSRFDELPANCAPLQASLKKIYGAGENMHGEVIKAFMTTKSGAEGLDLKHIRFVHIMEPYWQPVLIEQVIGRAVRLDSHVRLPPAERNVTVYIYMASILPNSVPKLSYVDVRQDVAKYNDGLNKKGKVVSSDESLFITSARKKVITGELLGLIKDSSVDCTLNYADNIKDAPGLMCIDYETRDREEYLYTPGLEDTMNIMDIKQELPVAEQYTPFTYKSVTYYYNSYPGADGKTYIYDDTLMSKNRKPVPIGQIVIRDGKKVFGFYPKPGAAAKKK
jgi:superfamily II DNA or RNA helicase